MLTPPVPPVSAISAAASLLSSASNTNSDTKYCCFVYGTLMSQRVLRTLLGRVPKMTSPAYLLPPKQQQQQQQQHFSRHPVIGQVYPGVIDHYHAYLDNDSDRRNLQQKEDKKSKQYYHHELVEGILLSGITSNELQVFDWFEDDDYDRCTVPVSLESNTIIDAEIYIWSAGNHLLDLESPWNFDDFCTNKLDWYINTTVRPCKEEIDRMRIGIEDDNR